MAQTPRQIVYFLTSKLNPLKTIGYGGLYACTVIAVGACVNISQNAHNVHKIVASGLVATDGLLFLAVTQAHAYICKALLKVQLGSTTSSI
tara:strand:+ start:103889 stop:104161 length:273 start_codon:yes stop_codon:yes gene_type:complete